jgi:hypothetical protein
MKWMGPRIALSLGLFALLFVFFIPIIYDPTMFRCTNGAFLCLTNPSGWKSLGFWLFHWGGAYSPGGAGDPQLMGYAFLPGDYFRVPGWLNGPPWNGGQMTAFGVVFSVAVPAFVAAIGLMGPEIIRRSRAARAGFTAFGAFVFALAALMYVSMISQGFHPLVALLGEALGAMGGVMVLFGLQRWMFGPEAGSAGRGAEGRERLGRLAAVSMVTVTALAVSGFTLAPLVQVRPAATVDVCDAGPLCFAEYASLSCVTLGFGEVNVVGPGYGYDFATSNC